MFQSEVAAKLMVVILTFQLIIKISRTILVICSVSSWLRTRLLTRSTFSSVRALRGPLLSMSLLTVLLSLNCHQQPVNATFCPSFVWKFLHKLHLFVSLQLIQILDQNLIFIAKHDVYKYCSDLCNDIILVP